MGYIADSTDKELSKKATDYLIRNFKYFSEHEIENGNLSQIADMLESLVDKKDFITNEELKNLFLELIKGGKLDIVKVNLTISMLTIASKKEARNLALNYLEKILKSHNLPYKKMFDAWQRNAKTGEIIDNNNNKEKITIKDAQKSLTNVIFSNLMTIDLLELKQRGTASFLHNNYGISNFGRFNKEIWLDQYNEREKVGPYGLVITSEDDWNSSSFNDVSYEAYTNLQKKVHPIYPLRIIEVISLPKLAKLLHRLKRKYEKIPDFVVWSGHSSDREFFLGPNRYRKENYKFSIDKEDFEGEAGKRIEKYLKMFSSDTTMIFDACSGGTEKSLPAIAANTIGNKFIYPKGITSVKDFGVGVDSDGNVSF